MNNARKKKAAFLAIAVVGLGTAAACGPPEPNAGGDPTKEDTLVFSTWQYDEAGSGDFWREAITEFEDRNPDVAVDVRSQPSTAYWDQLVVELQGPQPPDLIHVSGFNLHEIDAMGAIQPIDEMMDESGLSDRIEPAAIDYTTIDDNIMGYPVSGRTMELIYNERVLSEAGFDRPPSTPDEFLEYARALTVRDGDSVMQYGTGMPNLDDRYTYESILYWTIAHGGNLAADGAPTLTDPGAIDGIEFMKTLYDEELVPQGMPYPDQRQLLAQGNMAMLIDGSWLFPLIEEINSGILDDIRVARVPWNSGISTGGPMHILTVGADSQHAELAQEFIQLIAEPEWQQKYFQMAETLPYGIEVVSDDDWADKPYFEAYVDSLPTAAQIPPEGMEESYSTFSAEVQTVVTGDIFLNDVPVQEALSNLQNELQ